MAGSDNPQPAKITLIAVFWYAVAFVLAAAGAFFADSQPYVTHAWHVYFIEKSRGVLTSDSEVTRSEIYRLIMATVGSLLCIACFLNRFNTKSPRDSIATALGPWERRVTIFFAGALFLVTLFFMPANLHALILLDNGGLNDGASLGDEFKAIAHTIGLPFPGGKIVVKGQRDFGSFSQVLAQKIEPAKVASVTLWRNPTDPTKSVLIATSSANVAATASPAPPDEARIALDLRGPSATSHVAAALLGSPERSSYFSEIWRPYLVPYSFYSIGLYLLIIYPVAFLLLRSVITDRRRFRSPDLAKPEPPQTESQAGFETFQKQSEYRLDAIRDILPRYLTVAMIVYIVATIEYLFSFIRASSTAGATVFGQLALGLIWPVSLVVCGVIAVFYVKEYNYGFAGLQDIERLSHGDLYKTVRDVKISFRNEYHPRKMLAAGGAAAVLLTALLWLLPKIGSTMIIPSFCGAIPHQVSDPFVKALHASGLTTKPDCEH